MSSVSQFLPLNLSGLLLLYESCWWWLAGCCLGYQASVHLHESFIPGLRPQEQLLSWIWHSHGRGRRLEAGEVIEYVVPYVMFAPTSKQVTYPHPKSVGWGRMFCLLAAMAKAKRKWFIDFMSHINKCNQMAQNPVGTV